MKKKLREKYWTGENKETLVEFKNIFLVLLVLIDLIFIFIVSFYDVSYNQLIFMSDFDLLVCILLFLDLVNEYKKSEESLGSFISSHILEIVAVIPLNYLFLRYFAVFRLFRLLQVFQIFKFIGFTRTNVESFTYFVHNRLLKTFTILLILYIVLITIVLNKLDPAFSSLFDALWYNIVTLTGVGYGDIVPVTFPSKVIAIVTIIMGVLFVSVFTAAMSSIYMEKPEQETRRRVKSYITHLMQKNEIQEQQIENLNNDILILHDKINYLTKLIEENNKALKKKDEKEKE